MLGAALDTIVHNEQIKANLIAKDRLALRERTLSLFARLHAEHEITHLYFTDPDRVNILRVHKPEKYGDKINRFTTLEAERTGKPSHGIELGPLGTFTLRMVEPWYDGQQLIGYVELGEEIEHITRKLCQVLSVEIYVLIKKEYLDRANWESGMKMLGRDATWDRFPSLVMIDHTLEGFPEHLARFLAEEHHPSGETDIGTSFNDRRYRTRFIHLNDAGGRVVGEMVVMTDVTDMVAHLHNTVLMIGAICLGVGGVLFALLFLYVGLVERQMATASEKLIRVSKAVESTSDAVIMFDLTGQPIYQNKAFLELFGYKVEDLRRAGGLSIHYANPRVEHEVFDTITRGKAWRGVVEMRTREDSAITVSLRADTIKGEKGQIVGSICIYTDITERKFAEEKLRKSEENFRSLSTELELGLSEVLEALRRISSGDPEIRIPETSELELISVLKQTVNRTAQNLEEIVDLSHEFAIGLAEHFDVLHRVSKGDLTARVSGLSQVELLELLKKETNQMIESVFKEMTERERAEEALSQYRDQLEEEVQERTVELRRTNELLQQEIGDRMRKEKALRLSEERYRALFENNPIETIIVDLEGRVTGFNKAKERAAREKTNDRLPELRDRMYTEDYAGRHKVNMREELMDCLASGKLKDFPELQYDNRFLHINISPFSDGAIITSVDITKRKRAEEALRASEEKYSSLVKNSLTGIYIDQDGKIVFANKRFAEIYRYSVDELLGMESRRLVHPDDRVLTDAIRTERLKGKVVPSEYEAKGLTKDGEMIWITRRNTYIEYEGRHAILGNVVDITESKRAGEKLLAYHKRLRSLASELSLAEERERRRIATEVHDRIGQNLAFAKLSLGTLLGSITSSNHRVAVDDI
jgi:PAS domain S-box-containing protein